jgi:glycosyltransferase involved in cell wall biosynthesis
MVLQKTEMTGPRNLPLVTFALFAYNQEEYIKEAVQGALAQDYEPLEIILSDDCSSDRTFETMIEMAQSYSGPNKIVVRRNPANRGLCLHVKDVAELARGDWIVVAAGDDISHPYRTRAMIEALTNGAFLYGDSAFDEIDEQGVIKYKSLAPTHSEHYIWTLLNSAPENFASGATAVYRIDFIRGAIASAAKTIDRGHMYYEDVLFAVYATALCVRPLHLTDMSLVSYRISHKSLTNFQPRGERLSSERSIISREVARSRARIGVINMIEEISSRFESIRGQLNFQSMRNDLRLAEVEVAASDLSFKNRLMNLMRVSNSKEFRVALSRIFGLEFLARLRLVRRKILK